jgi:hypothetical protein
LSAEVLLPAMQEHLNLIAALKLRDPLAVAEHLAFHIHSAHQRVLGQDRRVLTTPARLDNPAPTSAATSTPILTEFS